MVPANDKRPDAFALSDAVLLLAGVSTAMPGLWTIFAQAPRADSQSLPGLAVFPYAAAVLFLLAGTALVSIAGARRSLALGLAALTAVGSAIQAGAALFPSAGLATLATFPDGALTPAPIALCLWLSGVGTMAALSGARALRPLAVVSAALIVGIALTGALGELFGMPRLTAWLEFPPLPFDVALGLLSLGTGVLALTLRFEGGAVRWVPTLATGTTLAVATLCLYHGIGREERIEHRRMLESKGADLRDELTARFHTQLAPIIRMANRWEAAGRPKQKAWETEALVYLRHFDALDAIQWMDAGDPATIPWVAHRPGLLSEEEEISAHRPSRGQDEELATARQTRQAQLVRAKAGEQVLYEMYVPLFPGKRFDGFLVGRFRAREWLETATEGDIVPGVAFAISQGDEAVFSKRPRSAGGRGLELDLPLYGLEWKLHVWPAATSHGPFREIAPAVLVVGGILTFLVVLLVHLFQLASLRAAEKERTSFELAESEARLRRQAAELTEARGAALDRLEKQAVFLDATRHELQSLVGQMRRLAGQLLASKLTPRQKDCARAIASWAEPVQCLLDDMADFTSDERGKLRLATVDFEVERLVADMRAMFAAAAKERGISITTGISPRVPPALRGDPARLRRILVHLFDGALAKLDGGEIALFVDVIEAATAAPGLRFELLMAGTTATTPPDIDEMSGSIAGRLVRMMSGEMGSVESAGEPTVLWFTAFVESARGVDGAIDPRSGAPGSRAERKAADANVVSDEDGAESAEAMLAAFSREVPAFLARIRQAVVLEEWHAIGEEAEGLRLLCANFGASRLASAAAALRRVSGPKVGDKALVLLKRLEGEFEATRSTMARERARLGSKSRKAA